MLSEDGPDISFVTPGDNEAYDDYGDGNNSGYTGRQGKELRLSAWTNLESRLTVGCAGALLTYMGRRKAVEYLPGDPNAIKSFRISAIETFSVQGVMYISSYVS